MRFGLPPDTSPLGPAAPRRGGATPRLHRDAASPPLFGGLWRAFPLRRLWGRPPDPTVRAPPEPAGSLSCIDQRPLFGSLASHRLLRLFARFAPLFRLFACFGLVARFASLAWSCSACFVLLLLWHRGVLLRSYCFSDKFCFGLAPVVWRLVWAGHCLHLHLPISPLVFHLATLVSRRSRLSLL